MNRAADRLAVLPSAPRAVPSADGLRLIAAGMGYLAVVCLVQLVVSLGALSGTALPLPSDVLGIRDVVALFGWVGLMISGVGVILVPNHLGVRVRPASLPRVHWAAANLGLIGFLGASLAGINGWPAEVCLAVVSLSFLAFGAGMLGTVLPFLVRPRAGRGRPGSRVAAADAPSGLSA